jgi:hypothetical protein
MEGSGLWLRIKERLEAWRIAGVSADIFICCRESSTLIQEPPLRGHRLHLLVGRTPFIASFGLPKKLASFNPDLIYMRYDSPYPPMIELARRWPTILEIHSDDKIEWRFYPLHYRVMGTLFRSSLLCRIDGIVMVDPELMESSNFPVKKVPAKTIPNGICIPDDTRYDTYRERQPGPSRLVLSVGNTLSWQGIDKFFKLALHLPDLEFHLVGLGADQVPTFPKNVTAHGRLLPGEVKPFLSTMDIGFGNLAPERAFRPYPSPLKVREYVAAGLPCVVAHNDPDLEGKDGILNLGYGFTDFEKAGIAVRDFALVWTGRACSLAMADSVNVLGKETERLAFFETVLRLHPREGAP